MRHGYTNETVLRGNAVVKRYRGPSADSRAAREIAALRWARGHVPVPEVVWSRQRELTTRPVPGRHGQDVIEDHPSAVLRACGELAASLHALAVPRFLGASAPDAVVVHGDFGPQNCLLDHDLTRVVALLDWELVHPGERIEDLAWAEWIVRRHHPTISEHVQALYEGYGWVPGWQERHGAMAASCRRHLQSAQQLDDEDGMALWEDRVAWTSRLRP